MADTDALSRDIVTLTQKLYDRSMAKVFQGKKQPSENMTSEQNIEQSFKCIAAEF